MGLNYAISIVNWIFLFLFLLKMYFLLFFTDFKSLMFHNDTVIISRRQDFQHMSYSNVYFMMYLTFHKTQYNTNNILKYS